MKYCARATSLFRMFAKQSKDNSRTGSDPQLLLTSAPNEITYSPAAVFHSLSRAQVDFS